MDQYLNTDSFVNCHISDAKFHQMRDMWMTNQTKSKFRKKLMQVLNPKP